MFNKDDQVRHSRIGIGEVISDLGETVIIRFGQKVEECAKGDLTSLPSFSSRLERELWDIPLEVINRTQAETISSMNDSWGIFSRSRIELLPHQLWVCHQVNSDWPIRWIVADDVGLGKTIEAGMILTPLLSNGRVRRLLIICPASLVEQWQERLRTMFDIRASIYVAEADKDKLDFWGTHKQIIASLHTLRIDRNGRHNRIVQSDPWDLVIVDEAHHLNADQRQGPTLGYQFINMLQENNRIRSMLFFTGTPHRGKDFGFVSLLQLLRPDLFDNKRPLSEQLISLRQVMIRNNKCNVTDLTGKRLFKEPIVSSETYKYSNAEQIFYDMLSEFIIQGRAYASQLSESIGSAVMLVLISMQKLASSSVAAIRRAIRGRLGRIQENREGLNSLQDQIQRYQEYELSEADNEIAQDRMAQIEENIATITSQIRLVENEEGTLREILAAAEAITEETKIKKILEVLDTRFENRSVLFFTEYKATQSLLMSALIRRFGDSSVTFINGDECANEIMLTNGEVVSLNKSREEAAEEFNSGKARFLVSTEAGGEGIDLQENCFTLIHVDLPWNPMRLHQRVGRLNRYGQIHRVEVMTLRNPDTVETRIWDKLNEKIDRINIAFRNVMDEPEDMLQLVLGMTSPTLFRDIFAEGTQQTNQSLAGWFNQKTALFGGKDVIDTVRNLVGNVNKFDFKEISDQIPRADLPDIHPFFESALILNNRRITQEKGGGISFITPDSWRTDPAIRNRYDNMIFNRKDHSQDASKRLLGIGHKVINKAIDQAKEREAAFATIPKEFLPDPVIIFRIFERITVGSTKPTGIVGVRTLNNTAEELIKDWEVLKLLNQLPLRKEFMRETSRKAENIQPALDSANTYLKKNLNRLKFDFQIPDVTLLSVLWPR